MRIQLDTAIASKAIQDGKLPPIFGQMIERIHPEAAYFYPDGGKRTALFVFDMKDSSELPEISERAFSELGATVEVFPCMNQEDLEKGLRVIAGQ